MEHGFEVVTTPFFDGRIVQETYSVNHGVREQIIQQVLNTQEQQIRAALMVLGWTPPNGSGGEIQELRL